MASLVTSIRSIHGVAANDLTSSPALPGPEVLVRSSWHYDQPAASDTEQTSPQGQDEEQDGTQVVEESYPRDDLGPVEKLDSKPDKPTTKRNVETRASHSKDMAPNGAYASLMAKRAQESQPPFSKPATTLSKLKADDAVGKATKPDPQTEEPTKQASRDQKDLNSANALPPSKTDAIAQPSDQKQSEARTKTAPETRYQAARAITKRHSKNAGNDDDHTSDEYESTKKPGAARKTAKATAKPKSTPTSKPQKPTRKQPRRSARLMSGVDDDDDHQWQEQKLTEFEKEVVPDVEKPIEKKEGASQRNAIEISDCRSSTPDSDSNVEQASAAPGSRNAIHDDIKSNHPSSPPETSIAAPAKVNAPFRAEQKPVVIAFGPQGPKNQGGRSAKQLKSYNIFDEEAAVSEFIESSVVANTTTLGEFKDESKRLINSSTDHQNKRHSRQGNTAKTVSDALDAFCLPKLVPAPRTKSELKPGEETDVEHEAEDKPENFMDIEDVLPIVDSPPAPSGHRQSSPLPDSQDSISATHVREPSPPHQLTEMASTVEPKATVVGKGGRRGKKRLSEEAEADGEPSKKKARGGPSTRSQAVPSKPKKTVAGEEPSENVVATRLLTSSTKGSEARIKGRRPQPPSCVNSVGAQSVDRDGSPIPPGIEVPKNATVLETYSQNVSSPASVPEEADDDSTMDGTTAPVDTHLKLPESREPQILSSNSKPVPASPTRASQVITRASVAKVDRSQLIVREDSNAMPTDPFTKSNRSVPGQQKKQIDHKQAGEQNVMSNTVLEAIARLEARFTSLEDQHQKMSPVIERVVPPPQEPGVEKQSLFDIQTSIQEALTKAFSGFEDRLKQLESRRQAEPAVQQPKATFNDSRKRTSQRRSASTHVDFEVYDEESDAEKTLVEADEADEAGMSKEDTPSLTSDHGSGDRETSPVTPEAPYTDIAMWRVSLKPHQINLFDELVHISHRLVEHLVSEEEADENMIKDFYRGGLNLIRQQEENRKAAYEEDKEFVEGEKARLEQHFKRWHGHLVNHERKAMRVMERMSYGLVDDEEEEGLEQQLLGYLDD